MKQVWLITGSSRGLGRALAEAVLAAGHQLVATARKPEQLSDLVERYGEQVRAVALDVTDETAVHDAVKAAVDAFGRLDVLVNNAGYGNVGSIEDTSLEDFRAQIETNLFGTISLSKAAIPLMREQGAGHIIQVSSVGGRMPTPGMSAYQAAKFAVGGFSEVLAQEVAPPAVGLELRRVVLFNTIDRITAEQQAQWWLIQSGDMHDDGRGPFRIARLLAVIVALVARHATHGGVVFGAALAQRGRCAGEIGTEAARFNDGHLDA